MIDNTFVWIDGSPGSGKTLLIERILESNRSKSIGVVRFRKNPKLRNPLEKSAGNEETRRYLSAGADGALLMEYPDNDKTSVAESFWCTDFLGNLFNAVYCEAELTDDQFPMDLNVFVLPPLEDPSSIFESRQVKVDDQLMRNIFMRELGHVAAVSKAVAKSFDACLDEVLAQSVDKIKTFPPLTILNLAPGFEGLIISSTVVVNIRNQMDRQRAERLLQFIDEARTGSANTEHTFGHR